MPQFEAQGFGECDYAQSAVQSGTKRMWLWALLYFITMRTGRILAHYISQFGESSRKLLRSVSFGWKCRLQREDVTAGDMRPISGKALRLIAQEEVLLVMHK